MAIRPLKIGAESRTNHFIQYQPSKGIFKELKDEVNSILADNCIVYSVNPNGKVEECDLSQAVAVPLPKLNQSRGVPLDENPYGIQVYCNDIPCIYEFRLFQYIGCHRNE
ncbi:PREDICTED: uncharacterized protein LOC109585971 [Amphimedon queenslandica]|uniref:Uncharacterized protein n=1 Tax=Amphimedon queenslandica TaxID=400682 RepID=A0A1X7TV21_AMPQE|nr:PREDICTED: uncharacterized protein LOC109585971 [Amphimedon queenslandica]|eukprot:XP_019857674.1 PREDICTED: uncharacterized protein LOC109585971 [Amphimedon queenslandica]